MSRLSCFIWGVVIATAIAVHWSNIQEERYVKLNEDLRVELAVSQFRLKEALGRLDTKMTPEEAIWWREAFTFISEKGREARHD